MLLKSYLKKKKEVKIYRMKQKVFRLLNRSAYTLCIQFGYEYYMI